MPIIDITPGQSGLVGVLPSLAYVHTNDPIATILTAGYLNKAVQNGLQLSFPCMAIVSSQETPHAIVNTQMLQLVSSGVNSSIIIPSGNVDPGIVNHLAIYGIGGKTVSAFASQNNSTLVSDSTGIPTWLANSGTAGWVLTANAGAPPSWQAGGGGGGSVLLAPSANQTITGGFDLVVSTGGNIQASSGALVSGSSGFAGELIIFPPTAGRGFLQVHAGNSAAAFNGLLTNLSLSASRTWSLPDSDGTIALVGAASSIALTGDTGTCTGAALTVFANQAAFNCGSSVSFDNSGTTSTLNVTDIGSNTVIGSSAGSLLSGSSSNCALGIAALSQLVSGGFNLALGSFAGLNFTGTENNNICINSNGVIGDNHTLRIGSGTNTFPQGLMTAYIHGVYSNTQPISGTVDYVTIDNTSGLMGVTSIAAPVGAVLLSPVGTQTITSNDLVLAAGDMYSTVAGFISGDPAGGSFGYFTAFPVGGSTLGQIQLICSNNVGTFSNVITNNPTTAPRTWSFPDADGTVALVGGGDNWVDQTTASVTMAVNTGYTSNDGASLISFTLPASSSVGDFVEINGLGTGLWKILQAAGQQIHISPNATTLGVGGSLASVNQYDNVRLRCVVADTIWTVVSQQSTGLTRV